MKNNQYTTIAQSRKLLDLGFQSYTASAKYTPLSTDPDKMSVTFGAPEDKLSIPAWTVGDLIDSLPVHIPDPYDRLHNLNISPTKNGWEVSYGTAFASTYSELIDSLLETIDFVFSKWNIRTRKDFHHSFFKSTFDALPILPYENSLYREDIRHRIDCLKEKYTCLKCYRVCSESDSPYPNYKTDYPPRAFMYLAVNKEECKRLLKEGEITEKDYIMALNISHDRIFDMISKAENE